VTRDRYDAGKEEREGGATGKWEENIIREPEKKVTWTPCAVLNVNEKAGGKG